MSTMPPSKPMSSSSLQVLSSRPTQPPPSLSSSLSSSSSSPLSSIAATHSPFSECRCRLTLHLHPAHLANLTDGIHSHLNSYLLTYQPHLASLVLSYHDVQLLSSTASIFYDRPYLNFPVQVTLLTLSMPAGTAHYGRVSKVGVDYVTLLVYGVLHCVIARSDIPAWYEFGVLDKEGRRTEMMADTRRGAISGWQAKTKSSLASATAGVGAEEQQLSKKQAAKQQKQQEKEQRRLAYLHSQQQQSANTTTTADPPTDSTDDDNALDYAIRLGSLVRFVILTSIGQDSFFSLSGSLTADGATVVPGDVVVPAELKAKEEAEDEERKRAEEMEATSVEKLFAGEEEQLAAEVDDTVAADGTTTMERGVHISKKELKQRKKQEKANRKAAKALRKHLHTQQQPTPSTTTAATTTTTTTSGVTVSEKAEVMRRREREEEVEELERRREEDNQVNSVVVNEVFSHVDEHVIDGKDGEGVGGTSKVEGELTGRKRGRGEVNGVVKAEVGREKKKKRERNG